MKKILLALFIASSFIVVTPAFAQSGATSTVRTSITNPLKTGDTVQDLFKSIIDNILIPIGAILAVLAFIWSGFLFVMAQGEPAKLETAKRALLYTAIGTAILLGAKVILDVITGTVSSLRT